MDKPTELLIPKYIEAIEASPLTNAELDYRALKRLSVKPNHLRRRMIAIVSAGALALTGVFGSDIAKVADRVGNGTADFITGLAPTDSQIRTTEGSYQQALKVDGSVLAGTYSKSEQVDIAPQPENIGQ